MPVTTRGRSKKASSKKASSKKTPSKKTPSKKAPSKKTPAKKTPTKKATYPTEKDRPIINSIINETTGIADVLTDVITGYLDLSKPKKPLKIQQYVIVNLSDETIKDNPEWLRYNGLLGKIYKKDKVALGDTTQLKIRYLVFTSDQIRVPSLFEGYTNSDEILYLYRDDMRVLTDKENKEIDLYKSPSLPDPYNHIIQSNRRFEMPPKLYSVLHIERTLKRELKYSHSELWNDDVADHFYSNPKIIKINNE